MSAANLPAPQDAITVSQFLDMDLPHTCQWLLVNGTVVSVTYPRHPHARIQSNIHGLLLRLAQPGKALVFTELAYQMNRTTAHSADVAVVSAVRSADATRSNFIVTGAPELVVEVMSRSNLPYDVGRLERDCLANGALMFWKVVIQHRKRLGAGTPDYSVRAGRINLNGALTHEIYEIDTFIAVNLPGVEGEISVGDIFAGVL